MNEEISKLTEFSQLLIDYLIAKSPQLIGAMVILILGFLVARFLGNLILGLCSRKKIDVTLSKFLSSAIKLMIIVMFSVVAVNKLGIEMTPFIALLGASAFGLSLAVQGPVSNYGAGIVLIITRPFKVDDTLTIHDITGLVKSINLGNTQLETEDGQEVTIPNRNVLGEIFTNSFNLMVVEGVVGVEYSGDPEQAIEAIQTALATIDDISQKPAPQVGIQEFGDSSINIGYRYWIPTSNYYRLLYAANLAVFKELKNAGITIPFPQREVRMLEDEL